MVSLISEGSKNRKILEPSAGKGVFLNILNKTGFVNITGIEIDSSLENESATPIIKKNFFDYSSEQKYDICIGNPPYVRWKNLTEKQRQYLISSPFWKKRMNGLSDILQPFIFKSVDHLKDGGELILITPVFWMQTLHAEPLRRYLMDNGSLELVINFHESRIFPNVNLNLIIFKYKKKRHLKNVKIINYWHKGKITNQIIQKITKIIKTPLSDNNDLIKDGRIEIFNTNQPNKSAPWKFLPANLESKLKLFEESCKIATKQLFEDQMVDYSFLFLVEDIRSLNLEEKDFQKIKIGKLNYYRNHSQFPLDSYLPTTESKIIYPQTRYARLADIVDIGNGMVSGLDKAFRIESKEKFSSKESKLVIPVVKAINIGRYYVTMLKDYYFIKPGIIPSEEALKTDYPLLFEQLKPFKDLLKNRYQYNRLIPYWEWVFLRNFKLMRDAEIKICVPCKDRFDKRGYLRFAMCGKGVFATQDVTVLVKHNWIRESIEYITAFLNSREVFNWVRNKGLIRGGVAEFSEQPLKVIPFRFINWDSSLEREIHNKITKLVHQIHEKKTDDLGKINEVNDLVSHLFT